MRPGDVIARRFEIERLAGAGGMGAVYRAHDLTTGNVVALKLLRRGSPEDEHRLEREARVLSELDHPSIVRYRSHGLTEQGEPFLVMEWLEGESLEQRLERTSMSVGESLLIVRLVAEALGVAHARGVLHRDIKPANVFLLGGAVDRIRVLDFGIARRGSSSGNVTRTGVLIGTLGYIAPEQARGVKNLDARTDVFSLGCVLFECLTGRRAFTGDQVMAVLVKVLFEEAPRVSDLQRDIPPALDDLVARMMAKDPARRPEHAAQVAAELELLQQQAGGRTILPAVTWSPALTESELRLVSVIVMAPPQAAANAAAVGDATVVVGGGRELLERLEVAVTSFGARLERLPEGSIVAALAGSGNATDQALQAARCALAMRAAAPDSVISLATGRGSVATRLPVGEVIDRAIALLDLGRLQADPATESGPPGPTQASPVRIDAVTHGLLDGSRFEMASDAEGQFMLLGERESGTEGGRRLAGRLTPCVGRERELMLLSGYLRESVEEPMARAILVTGETGVGKTRLRQEFLGSVRQQMSDLGVEVWLARSDPMAAGSPFNLLGQLVRRAAGVRDGEPLAERRRKLQERVHRCGLGDSEQRVLEFIGELVGTPFPEEDSVQLRAARRDPKLMGDQMRHAWLDFLAGACAAHPVIMVLENLESGDMPSVQWIDLALRSLREQPLFVLALARIEVHQRFPRLWAERNVQELRLGELSRKASERLVRTVLGKEVAQEIVERVVRQAEGNAFFLEELIRAVAEGQGSELPETVLAMVQVRLETLDTEARRVIRAASLFGDTFWSEGLCALLGEAQASPGLHSRLDQLVNREFIVRRIESRFPGVEEYAFRHSFVREAAYATLTDNDRALGHRLAGTWLEQRGEQEAVALARHFERGGNLARAATFYEQAARQALEANDFATAIERVDRAVACGAEGELLGAVRRIQAEAYSWRGEYAAAERCNEEAMQLLPRDHPLWFRAASLATEMAFVRGDHERILSLASGAEPAVPEPDARSSQLILLATAAKNLVRVGKTAEAEPLFQRLVSTRDEVERDPLVAGHVHAALGLRAITFCTPAVAHDEFNVSLTHFQRAGDDRNALPSRLHAAMTAIRIGALAKGEAELRECLPLATRLGLFSLVGLAKYGLSLALMLRGALDEACALLQGVLEGMPPTSNRSFQCKVRSRLTLILLRLGRPEEAEREGHLAVQLVERMTPHHCAALAAWTRALVALGRIEEAVAAARETTREFEALEGNVEEGEPTVRLSIAQALLAGGDREGARHAVAAGKHRMQIIAEALPEPVRPWFFNEVADHGQLQELARELGVE